jgi:subtilase family serine protease
VAQLAAGASAEATVSWTTAGKVGDFTVQAVADSTDAVRESDESNNDASATVGVLVGGVPGIDLLDPLG